MIPYTMAKRILEYPSLAVLEDAIHTRFELDDLGAVVDDLHAINDILWCPDKWNTKCSALVSSQIPFRVVCELHGECDCNISYSLFLDCRVAKGC
jgi:hypothetical protein